MSTHLTFDEIDAFLDKELDIDDVKALAYRTNEHINGCRECYKFYVSLLMIDEFAQALINSASYERKIKMIERLLTSDEPVLTERVSRWLQKLCECSKRLYAGKI